MPLQTYRERLRLLLQDTGVDIWEDDILDQGLRMALDQYNGANPDEAIATITITAANREFSIASLTRLIDVQRVWLPYTAATPEDPPRWRAFEEWPGNILYITDGSAPAINDVARIWHTRRHIVQGLDGAASDTLPAEHQSILVVGGAAFAALSRASDLAEEVTVDGEGYGHLHGWGFTRQNEFRAELNRLRNAARGNPLTLPPARRTRVRRA